LRDQPVDLELLAVDQIFRSPNLVGARWIGISAIEGRELGLEPLACGVRRL
jgi:hypothetical protein